MIEPGPDLRPPPVFDDLRIVFLILVLAALVQDDATEWTLTSWYRDPARNQLVGGAPASLHLQGLAIDVVGRPPSFVGKLLASGTYGATGLLGRWRSFGAPFQGVLESDHIHLELDLR